MVHVGSHCSELFCSLGGPGIVLDGYADDEPEMDLLFDAQRWDAAMDDIHFVDRDDGP